jgi:hypothetical protein
MRTQASVLVKRAVSTVSMGGTGVHARAFASMFVADSCPSSPGKGQVSRPSRQRCIPVCREILSRRHLRLFARRVWQGDPGVPRARECPPVPERVPAVYPRCSATRQRRQQNIPVCRDFAPKPSDGLEPSTPSLPWNPGGNRSQPAATVFADLSRFRRRRICHRLPAVATAGLHKGSILCCLL